MGRVLRQTSRTGTKRMDQNECGGFMSYTIDENGTVWTETRDGVTMPVDCSFEKVNDWIHGIDVQFEELQALCLGMADENDRLRAALRQARCAAVDIIKTLDAAALSQ